ncbi:MAG: hypothetical protein ACOCP8_03465 [archaeon]
MKEYKVVPYEKNVTVNEQFSYKETRYIIIDNDGVIIDDAQGYGYKTANSAHKAMWYKLGGGKQKIENSEKKLSSFQKNNQEFMKAFGEEMEFNFKELMRKEIEAKDILLKLEKKFNITVPNSIKKLLIK